VRGHDRQTKIAEIVSNLDLMLSHGQAIIAINCPLNFFRASHSYPMPHSGVTGHFIQMREAASKWLANS
jgi:hypothetical protein